MASFVSSLARRTAGVASRLLSTQPPVTTTAQAENVIIAAKLWDVEIVNPEDKSAGVSVGDAEHAHIRAVLNDQAKTWGQRVEKPEVQEFEGVPRGK